MRARLDLCILHELADECLGVKYIDPHGDHYLACIARHGEGGLFGFFLKPYHVHTLIGFDHAELVGRFDRHGHRPYSHIGLSAHMELNHLHIIHLVNVIAREDQGIAGHVLLEGIDVLEDCIGRALIPAIPDALLCRDVIDELSHGIGKEREPALLDVAVQGVGFVL